MRQPLDEVKHSTNNMQKSSKSYVVAVSLSGIFGILGIHHFYLGRLWHGLFDLSMSLSAFYLIITDESLLWGYLILGIDFIHTLIVTIMLLVGAYKDGEGNVVTYPGQTLKDNSK